MSRLTAAGTAQTVLRAQSQVLGNLISRQRIDRMSELEQAQTKPGYPPEKLFVDLRGGLFRELGAKPLEVDLYRRNLQRSYIDMLAEDIKTPAANSDLPAYARR